MSHSITAARPRINENNDIERTEVINNEVINQSLEQAPVKRSSIDYERTGLAD